MSLSKEAKAILNFIEASGEPTIQQYDYVRYSVNGESIVLCEDILDPPHCVSVCMTIGYNQDITYWEFTGEEAKIFLEIMKKAKEDVKKNRDDFFDMWSKAK